MKKQKILELGCRIIVIMIFLTILSRVTSNMSQAKIRVEMANVGNIQHEIIGTATVAGTQELPVITLEGLSVRSFEVEEGDYVKVGDVLFEVDLTKLDQTIQEKQWELDIQNLQAKDTQNSKEVMEQKEQLSYQQAIEGYNQAAVDQDEAVSAAELALMQAQDQYNQYIENPGSFSEQVTAEDLWAVVSEGQKQYNNAISVRESVLLSARQAVEMAGITTPKSTQMQQQEISKRTLQMTVEKLKEIRKQEGKIKSTVTGMITDIKITVGALTTDGGDILISDMSKGIKIKALFGKEFENEIKPDMQLILKGSSDAESWEQGDGYRIESVRKDNEKGQLEAVVTLPSASEYQMGETLYSKVVTPENSYACVIPLTALNQNEKGQYYVNQVVEKDTILGPRNIASSVVVTILDKDIKQAAVGGINRGDEVIVDSTKRITNGSRVKYRGNNEN